MEYNNDKISNLNISFDSDDSIELASTESKSVVLHADNDKIKICMSNEISTILSAVVVENAHGNNLNSMEKE